MSRINVWLNSEEWRKAVLPRPIHDTYKGRDNWGVATVAHKAMDMDSVKTDEKSGTSNHGKLRYILHYKKDLQMRPISLASQPLLLFT